MKTWHYEILIVTSVLCFTTFLFANNLINWITTAAIVITFNHASVGDRLQERQAKMEIPTVECYYKLNRLFAIKEVLWIAAFLAMKNYAAIVGSAMFFLYPIWRKYYRKHIKPLQ
jgi:O-antigen/teichoic acid export membrane protein